jgi:hypothetical protein
VNTADEPTRFSPKEGSLTDAAASFHRTILADSFTVLKLNATPQ